MKKTILFTTGLAYLLFSAPLSADKSEPWSAKALQKAAISLHEEYAKTQEERMQWWEDARFGMFIHFGVYSHLEGTWRGVPSKGYAEQIKKSLRISNKIYFDEVVSQFNPQNFNADEWVKMCKSAGMKYMVITAKHHDGFAMWHSKNPYNVVDATPFKRDVMQELRAACKRGGIHFCVYYSHAQEWHHPGGQRNRVDFPDAPTAKGKWYKDPKHKDHLVLTRQYVDEKAIPQLYEILDDLQPDLIWFDTASWLPPNELDRIYMACRKKDPNVIISGRIGNDLYDYKSTCDKPAAFPPEKERYWEAIPTTNESYGYSSVDKSHKSGNHFIDLLVGCVAKNGNLLLNAGPRGDGSFAQIDQDIFNSIGKWLKINSESIYECGSSLLPSQSWGYVTQPNEGPAKRIYLHIHQWPKDGKLIVSGLTSLPDSITALADATARFKATTLSNGLVSLQLPEQALQTPFTTLRLDFAKPLVVSNRARVLQQSIDENELHVFDDGILEGKIFYAQGHKDDQHVKRWTKPSDRISWNVQTLKEGTWDLKMSYQARPYHGRHVSKETEAPYLEKLKAITATITIDGKSYETPLKCTNPDENGYAEDLVATIKLPAGNHTVKVTAQGMTTDMSFYLKAIKFQAKN